MIKAPVIDLGENESDFTDDDDSAVNSNLEIKKNAIKFSFQFWLLSSWCQSLKNAIWDEMVPTKTSLQFFRENIRKSSTAFFFETDDSDWNWCPKWLV